MDIRTLEEGRASGGTRVVQGVQGLAPPMIVLSVLRDILVEERKGFESSYAAEPRVPSVGD